LKANEDVEYLANFSGPFALLGKDKKSVMGVITALDIAEAAKSRGITLVPSTLAECMQDRPDAYKGKAEPLAISKGDGSAIVVGAKAAASAAKLVHPHFVDTKKLEWLVNEETPDVGLKILRVSEETGVVSVIVRHNGEAPPHYHLGASDFLVLGGRIGYRAGPPEGYGPGMWFFEPAGARHDSTQRVGSGDLIYLANVYGPIQFDEGRDTPIAFVFSWMTYKAMADGAGSPLVRNSQDGSLLAWAPIGSNAAKL
jgi:quercetin dioxygenase-like cupin family protein